MGGASTKEISESITNITSQNVQGGGEGITVAAGDNANIFVKSANAEVAKYAIDANTDVANNSILSMLEAQGRNNKLAMESINASNYSASMAISAGRESAAHSQEMARESILSSSYLAERSMIESANSASDAIESNMNILDAALLQSAGIAQSMVGLAESVKTGTNSASKKMKTYMVLGVSAVVILSVLRK